ncbi:MAG TPA: tripartite tricarboxylate transporter substrate binding protein, partial [Burkholderiaceae bacterium]|nr:tripartite tricarboxylate transporter substrate binding protein [Burkholderiaceae bacterium]
ALPSVLVIHSSIPAGNLKEFIAYAKQKGGEITCASHGLGSFNHLACMQFNEATGTQMTHVPYKGASQVNLDLLPGRVLVYFAVLPTVLSHIQNGQLKALATGDEVRLKPLPQVPTLREAGVPGITISQWNALFVRAGTPEPVLIRLREATARILRKPDVIAKIDATGSVMRDMTAAELGRMTAGEYSLYQTLSQRYDIKME